MAIDRRDTDSTFRELVRSIDLQAAIENSLERGALVVKASVANPEARKLYEKHHFEQFMGKWTMGEIFLELNVPKYKTWLLSKPAKI